MLHACIYIHACLGTQMNGSPMRARRTHAPTCCVRACARVRVRLGAHASAPTHASDFRRRRPRVARLVGVQRSVGVQREHRRMEHRRGHHVVPGMRRLFGPGGAPPWRDALGGSSMRRGPLCAVVWARACAGVHVCRHSCAYERRDICMYIHIYMYVCMYVCMYVYVYTYKCMYVCIIHTYVGVYVLA